MRRPLALLLCPSVKHVCVLSACTYFRRTAVTADVSPGPASPHSHRPAAFAGWPQALWPTHAQSRHPFLPTQSRVPRSRSFRPCVQAEVRIHGLRFRVPESRLSLGICPHMSASHIAQGNAHQPFLTLGASPRNFVHQTNLLPRASLAQVSPAAAGTGGPRHKCSQTAIDDKYPFCCLARHPNRLESWSSFTRAIY